METANSIAGAYKHTGIKRFHATSPATGEVLEGTFNSADMAGVDEAMCAAAEAFTTYRQSGKNEKAAFLRTIANEIEEAGGALIERASAESGLPPGRLLNELCRTTVQLRLFADMVEEGSWVCAAIETGLPERQPQPRPDIRKMLVPLGPVVVFGASNFPLAFSVAGGDTASALAAGCPVVVKAHPAHPGTSALVAAAVNAAVKKCDMPPGVFSMLYDDGHEIGAALVMHPLTRAVTFTGSLKGGMALQQLAAQRAVPVPVFAEMGSINPVLLLPAALEKRATAMAGELAVSITLSGGQFCTKPGLLLALQSPALEKFAIALATGIRQTPPVAMLTAGIHHHYHQLSTAMMKEKGVELLAEAERLNNTWLYPSHAKLAKVSAKDFLHTPALQEEVFGPCALLVVAEDINELHAVAASLQGQLTVTVMAETQELSAHAGLIRELADIAGRIVLNGVPTGVEVCATMQHGGPFPATTDSRFTSVGHSAIYRFVRPLAWQNWADELLPDELKATNPLNILRTTDLTFSRI